LRLSEGIGAAKVLLNAKLAGVLPVVVLVREKAGLNTNLLLDLLESNLLVLRGSDGLAIAVTRGGPSDLGDVGTLLSSLGADLGGLSELGGGKVTSHLGGDGGSEVRVDLDSEDVNVVAESGTVVLPGTDGLGGGDGNVGGETAALELLADVVEVATELAGLAVVVEDALVANNDHGNAVLGSLVLDVLELAVGVAGEGTLATSTATLKEDTVDDLQAVLLAFGNNVLEDTAVGAVGADGGETHLGDLLDIGSDLSAGPALSVLGIRSVGHGPLVTVGDDVASGAVASGRLGLVSCLGAGRSRLGGVGRLGVDRHWGRLGRLRLGGRSRVSLRWLGSLRLGRSRWVGRGGGHRLHGRRRDHDWGVDGDGSLGLLILGAGSGCRCDPGGVGHDGRH
jgi:hypothetical protein